MIFPQLPTPIFIPRPLAERIRQGGKNHPLWLQFVPQAEENSTTGLIDPIGDSIHQATGQLIHRYKNKALFLPTTRCPINCRYCFRKNELYAPSPIFTSNLATTVSYLKKHPEIEEVIYSGGDPFILSDKKLEQSFLAFSKIDNLKYIRFHTRFPTILPERFFSKKLSALFMAMAKRFDLVTLTIHINHLQEIDGEVEKCLSNFRTLPLRVMAQSVLLRGINDDSNALQELFLKLAQLGVTPHYLHHPDRVRGGGHFYLPLSRGRKIYTELKKKLLAQVLPHYVVELPDGDGKVLAMENRAFNL